MALDRTVSVKLKAEVAGYMAGLRQAGAATASFAKKIDQGAAKNHDHLNKLGGALAVVGTIAAVGVGAAVKSFADFEQAMSGVQAATHASASTMKELQAAALQAGADTKFSATEAANAQEELAKAGVSTADILGGALTGALNLAAAGELGVAEAATISATAMTQFGLSGRDVPHIADLLAAAAGKAQGSVADMGAALNYIGPIAHGMGISIEETTGAIAMMAQVGVTGSEAGTQLRSALVSLSAPSDKAREVMQDLGISMYDATGKFVGIDGAAQQLQDGLKPLSNAERDLDKSILVSNVGLTAANVLFEAGAAGVHKATQMVDDFGFAQDTAAIKMNNLSGDLEQFKGSLETLLIQGGEGSSGFLRGALQTLTDFTNWLGKLSPHTKETALSLATVTAAASLLAAGAIKATTALAAMNVSLKAVGASGQLSVAALTKFAIAAGAITAAAIAADQLYATLGKHKAGDVGIDALADSMLKLKDQGELSGETIRLVGADLGAFGRDADDTQGAMTKLVTTFREAGSSDFWEKVDRLGGNSADVARLGAEMGTLDGALAKLVKDGHGEVAADQFEHLKAAALAAHYPMEKFNQLLPLYGAALNDGSDAAGKAANAEQAHADALSKAADAAFAVIPPIDKVTIAQEGAAKAAADHKTALDTLVNSLRLVNNEMIGAVEAGIHFQDAIDGFTKATKDNGTALNDNTVKARANKLAIVDLIKTAVTHSEAVTRQTGSTRDGIKAFNDDVAAIRKVALARGLDKTAVDKLIDSLTKIPKAKVTEIKFPGLDPAITKTKAFRDYLKHLPPAKQVKINLPGAAGAIEQAKVLKDYIDALHNKSIIISYTTIGGDPTTGGGSGEAARQNRASGGYISGPGGPRTDSIPAWLSNGEYVVNAAATSLNRTLLDAMNYGRSYAGGVTTMRQPNTYAQGGPVRHGASLTLEQHVTVANLDDLNRKTQHSMRDLVSMANLRGA